MKLLRKNHSSKQELLTRIHLSDRMVVMNKHIHNIKLANDVL